MMIIITHEVQYNNKMVRDDEVRGSENSSGSVKIRGRVGNMMMMVVAEHATCPRNMKYVE